MTNTELLTLLQRGPRTFDESVVVRKAFASAISNSLVASNLEEQQRWLSESDLWRRWLPDCIALFNDEVHRLEFRAHPWMWNGDGTLRRST